MIENQGRWIDARIVGFIPKLGALKDFYRQGTKVLVWSVASRSGYWLIWRGFGMAYFIEVHNDDVRFCLKADRDESGRAVRAYGQEELNRMFKEMCGKTPQEVAG